MKSKFEKVYDAYYDSVYRYIYASVKDKWNAEDIIATVFMKIYESRNKISSVEGCRSWVFTVAHNAIIDFYRKNKKVVSIEEYIENGEEEKALNDILIKDEMERVKQELQKLPEEVQQLIYMRYYGELKFKEIAEITHKPESTVKTSIFRALEKIRKLYEGEQGGKIYEKR